MTRTVASVLLSLATVIGAPVHSMPLFSGEAQALRLSSGDAREMPPGVVSDFQGNVRSAHAVKVDIRALAKNELTRAKADEDIEIVLPTGASYVVSSDRFTPVDGFLFDLSQGGLILDPEAEDDEISYHWYGATEDVELSLYVHFGVTSGTLRAGSTSWNLISHDGVLVLRELAMRKRLLDGVVSPDVKNLAVPTATGKKQVQAAAPKAHDTISVLVVYSTSVMLDFYDESELASQTQLMIANLNTALQNSGMTTVSVTNAYPGAGAALPVTYSESNEPDRDLRWITHLEWARLNTGTLRDIYEADIVVMLVRDLAGYSGYAYVQTSFVNGADFEGSAFAVANDLQSVHPDSHAFSHEVGHLLGMNHDVANTSPGLLAGAVFPWSFGWQDAQADVHDIMSYGTTCDPDCNKTLNFSNPEINFAGTSVASGTFVTDAQGRSAFNALTGSLLALPVSEYRGPRVIGRVFRGGFETLERPTP